VSLSGDANRRVANGMSDQICDFASTVELLACLRSLDSVTMVAKPAGILVAMTAILLPGSLALFAAAVRKGRKEGTLMEY
jgi:hypothetical protein